MQGFQLPSLPIAGADDEGGDSDNSLIEVPHGDNDQVVDDDEENGCKQASMLDRLPQMPVEVETARSL